MLIIKKSGKKYLKSAKISLNPGTVVLDILKTVIIMICGTAVCINMIYYLLLFSVTYFLMLRFCIQYGLIFRKSSSMHIKEIPVNVSYAFRKGLVLFFVSSFFIIFKVVGFIWASIATDVPDILTFDYTQLLYPSWWESSFSTFFSFEWLSGTWDYLYQSINWFFFDATKGEIEIRFFLYFGLITTLNIDKFIFWVLKPNKKFFKYKSALSLKRMKRIRKKNYWRVRPRFTETYERIIVKGRNKIA